MVAFYPAEGCSSASLSGSTLIVPSVSLGNLPQLAVDLIITSLGLERLGWIGTGDTVAPFAGMDNGAVVTGGMEVYAKPGLPLAVVQQRSPTMKAKKDEHVSSLRNFVQESGIAFTLILSSLDAADRDDAQLLTPVQRILPPTSDKTEIRGRLAKLPPFALHLLEPSHTSATQSTHYPPFLPSAGLTRRLLGALDDPTVPHGALAAWCIEGDNREDAVALARAALFVAGVETTLKEPPSWAGLFGAVEGWSGGLGSDAEIYGFMLPDFGEVVRLSLAATCKRKGLMFGPPLGPNQRGASQDENAFLGVPGQFNIAPPPPRRPILTLELDIPL